VIRVDGLGHALSHALRAERTPPPMSRLRPALVGASVCSSERVASVISGLPTGIEGIPETDARRRRQAW